MNIARALNHHQLFWLKRIANGQCVLTRVEGTKSDYVSAERYYVRTGRKPSTPCGSHLQKAVFNLFQRGVLVDADGRLVLSDAAAKQFGRPPGMPAPKRQVKMSRTRPARDQGSDRAKARARKGWCSWANTACPRTCPVPSVDNFGNPYPGCALVRLKSQAEIDAMTAGAPPSESGRGEKA
jgi:hypothetical protein